LIYNVVLMRSKERISLKGIISSGLEKVKKKMKPGVDGWPTSKKPKPEQAAVCPEAEKMITDHFDDL